MTDNSSFTTEDIHMESMDEIGVRSAPVGPFIPRGMAGLNCLLALCPPMPKLSKLRYIAVPVC